MELLKVYAPQLSNCKGDFIIKLNDTLLEVSTYDGEIDHLTDGTFAFLLGQHTTLDTPLWEKYREMESQIKLEAKLTYEAMIFANNESGDFQKAYSRASKEWKKAFLLKRKELKNKSKN